MSKKHFNEYYRKVCDQYSEMLQEIREIEEAAKTQVIHPDIIENMKKLIEPLKNNYMTLGYVAFLLNQPNKDSKEKRFYNQHKKEFNKLDIKRSPEAVYRENNEILNKLKEIT